MSEMVFIWEFFFLTGPIWGRTVFCIDIGNIVYIHMVKFNLPHIYMIFGECQRKQACLFSLKYPRTFQPVLGSYATLSSLSPRILWVRSNFFKDTLFFFSGLDRGASRVFHSFSKILYSTFSPLLFHGQ